MLNFLAAHWGDLLVLAVLGLVMVRILGSTRRKKRGCCGDCGQCGGCHMGQK